MRPILFISAVVVFAVTILLVSPALSQSFSIQTVLQTSDITVSAGTLPLFEDSGFAGNGFTTVTVDANMFFRPIEMYDIRSGQAPVVVSTGGLTEPTNGDPFSHVFNPQGNGAATSFLGIAVDSLGNPTARGVYLNQSPGSSLETVAVTGQPLPGVAGGNATVTSIAAPVLAGDNLAFRVITDGDLSTEQQSIVTRPTGAPGNTSFTTLVDTNTAVPNRANDTFIRIAFASAGYDGNRAAFRGSYDDSVPFEGEGIYTVAAGEAPELVIEKGTELPGNGLSDQYSLGGAPVISGDNVVFSAIRFNNGGIYLANDMGIAAVVDSSTPLPHDPNETFLAPFSFYSADDGRVAFVGRGSDESNGVYLYDQGEIVPVLTTLDQLNGFPVGLTDISANGFVDDQLILDVVLVDNANMSFFGEVVLVDILGDLLCDSDTDGDCDIDDLDNLYAAFGAVGGPFDFDGDGTVAAGDIIEWLVLASDPSNTALLDPTNILVLGDVDLNGDVLSADLGLLLNAFGDGPGANWAQGDLDGNGEVDSADLGLLLNNFNHTSLSSSAVPEPGGCFAWMIFLTLICAAQQRPNFKQSRRREETDWRPRR